MYGKLLAFAALCAVLPGAALSADGSVDVDVDASPEESAYAVIVTWANSTGMADTGETDIEAISEGGYSVIRTSWVPPKDSGYSAYPLWGIFPDLLERSGGGTVTAYEGAHPEGRGNLVVYWGNVSADQAVLCAGFGSYDAGQYKCPPSPDKDTRDGRETDRSQP